MGLIVPAGVRERLDDVVEVLINAGGVTQVFILNLGNADKAEVAGPLVADAHGLCVVVPIQGADV